MEGDVELQEGRVSAVGVRPSGRGGVAAPGFVDLQVNGFAGVDFLGAGPEDYRRVGEALASTGVVASQPTMISSPEDAYPPPLAAIAAAVGTPGPRILGAHLEGPFLSPAWAGAHNPGSPRPATGGGTQERPGAPRTEPTSAAQSPSTADGSTTSGRAETPGAHG